jgi:hypothetical protein
VPSDNISKPARQFSEIPSINYELASKIEPGQDVYMSAVPVSFVKSGKPEVYYELVDFDGVYLGSAKYDGYSNISDGEATFDVVAIKTKKYSICLPGASGSSFTTDEYVSGPLTGHVSINKENRLGWVERLGVDFGDYDTLCLYAKKQHVDEGGEHSLDDLRSGIGRYIELDRHLAKEI